MIQLFAETGIRRAELAALEVSDLRTTECLLLIRRGKNSKQRIIPLTSSICADLSKYIAERTDGPLFVSRKGSFLSTRQVNRLVEVAGKNARIKNPNPKYAAITPHLFRHSFARHWKASGASIETLAAILGHESTRTTWDCYGKESIADIIRNYQETTKKIFPNSRRST